MMSRGSPTVSNPTYASTTSTAEVDKVVAQLTVSLQSRLARHEAAIQQVYQQHALERRAQSLNDLHHSAVVDARGNSTASGAQLSPHLAHRSMSMRAGRSTASTESERQPKQEAVLPRNTTASQQLANASCPISSSSTLGDPTTQIPATTHHPVKHVHTVASTTTYSTPIVLGATSAPAIRAPSLSATSSANISNKDDRMGGAAQSSAPAAPAATLSPVLPGAAATFSSSDNARAPTSPERGRSAAAAAATTAAGVPLPTSAVIEAAPQLEDVDSVQLVSVSTDVGGEQDRSDDHGDKDASASEHSTKQKRLATVPTEIATTANAAPVTTSIDLSIGLTSPQLLPTFSSMSADLLSPRRSSSFGQHLHHHHHHHHHASKVAAGPGAASAPSGVVFVRSIPKDSVVTMAGHVSPSMSHTSGDRQIKAAPWLTGQIFNSGLELVKCMEEHGGGHEGVSMELHDVNSSSFVSDAGSASVTPEHSGTQQQPQQQLVPLLPKSSMSAADKWKHRVSQIQGKVQCGTKETLFGVRTEIELLHKSHPHELEELETSVSQSKADLVQAFQIVNHKQYIKDAEELQQQIAATDEQVDVALEQHDKFTTMLQTAVVSLTALIENDGHPLNIPGIRDADITTKMTGKEIEALIESQSNPLTRQRLALRAFLVRSKEKLAVHEATAAHAKAARCVQRAVPDRLALINAAREHAAACGVNLDAEVRLLPPIAGLDSEKLAQIEDELLLPLTAKNGSGGGAGATGGGADGGGARGMADAEKASLVNRDSVARTLSSLRIAVGGEQEIGASPSPRSPARHSPSQDSGGGSSSVQGPTSKKQIQQSSGATNVMSPLSPGSLIGTAFSPEKPQQGAAVGRPNASSGGSGSTTAAALSGFQQPSPLRPSGGASGGAAAAFARHASSVSIHGSTSTGSLSHQQSSLSLHRRRSTAAAASFVYTSTHRQDDIKKLDLLAERLRTYAAALRKAAAEDRALRVTEEAARERRLQTRSIEEALRDAIENRPPSPVRHIGEEDAARIQQEADDAVALAGRLTVLREEGVQALQFREELFGKQKFPLLAELKELEERILANTASLMQASRNRKGLVKQYWNWRHRVELGDATAAVRFDEEVQRGPPFRNVGVQNSVQSDFLMQQVSWLRQFLKREDVFRRQLQKIEQLVSELQETNRLMDRNLICPVGNGTEGEHLLEDPVAFWPCGHTFCASCVETLVISPSLHRCSVCYSVGSEGTTPNYLVAEILAKWAFKQSGYSNLGRSIDDVKDLLRMFHRDRMQMRLNALEYRLRQNRVDGYLTIS